MEGPNQFVSGEGAAEKPVDMHVHLVGNGSGGTGCWFRVKGWHRPMTFLMERELGLPFGTMYGDLDRLYVERLLELVRGSSLGAVVLLAQDIVYESNGKPARDPGAFYVPNKYVLRLAREHPEFLPAVSIHPARRDAMEELERCLADGAVMMKCLPNCHGIDCSDRRYTRFWERMAEAGLPLLAHTGGEHTLPVICPELADPRRLRLPLECGVTVIAAHCATKSGIFDPEYFHAFAGMTQEFSNFYGDNSAFNVPIRGRLTRECLRAGIVTRILHGSDLPVPVHGHWAWMRGLVDWKTFRRWEREPNVLERDYQLKLAMGFPAECFTRVRGLLRRVERAGGMR